MVSKLIATYTCPRCHKSEQYEIVNLNENSFPCIHCSKGVMAKVKLPDVPEFINNQKMEISDYIDNWYFSCKDNIKNLNDLCNAYMRFRYLLENTLDSEKRNYIFTILYTWFNELKEKCINNIDDQNLIFRSDHLNNANEKLKIMLFDHASYRSQG